MQFSRAACLSFLVLVSAMPARLRAEEPAAGDALTVREFPMEHVDVNQANAIVRSILNPRKSAIDERRQVLILADTQERLEKVATLLAQVDAAIPEWSVSLVARAGEKETVLRTASITQGRLEVQFGSSKVTDASPNSLGIAAAITRAASGEVDLDWTTSLGMTGPWTESAHALETLHDDATVVLVKTDAPTRQIALARLLGVPGNVDALVLLVARGDKEAPAR